MQEANGGYSFTFEVDADKAGTTVPIVLGKPDGTWYTKKQLYLAVPGSKTPEVTPIPEPTETPVPTATPTPSETPVPTATPTPEPAKVENGIYSGTAETGAAMFKVVGVELTVKDGDMKARITLSGVAYDYLYMGTPEEAAAADKSAWIAGVGTVDYTTADGETKTGMQYDIPVAALDQALVVSSHSAKRDKWYARTITIASSSLKKTADLPADETNKVADGIYSAEATTNAAMFKVVGVKLTAKNGKMTAVITLSGSGYDYLYMGTGKDAAAESGAWIASTGKVDYTLDGETKTGMQFEIPVEALDQERDGTRCLGITRTLTPYLERLHTNRGVDFVHLGRQHALLLVQNGHFHRANAGCRHLHHTLVLLLHLLLVLAAEHAQVFLLHRLLRPPLLSQEAVVLHPRRALDMQGRRHVQLFVQRNDGSYNHAVLLWNARRG